MGMEENPEDIHPLQGGKLLASLTAMVFWGTGVTLMDPRLGLGVILCSVSVIYTVWLYFGALKNMRIRNPKTWPALCLFLLVIQISIPGYILYSKAEDKKDMAAPPTNFGSSTNQNGGQTAGTINNNGPVNNGQTAKPPCSIFSNSFDVHVQTTQPGQTAVAIGPGVCDNDMKIDSKGPGRALDVRDH